MTPSPQAAIAAAAAFACCVAAIGVRSWLLAHSDERMARSLGGTIDPPFGAGLDRILERLPLFGRLARLLEQGNRGWRLAQLVTVWALVAYPAFALLRAMYGTRLGLVLTGIGIPGLSVLVLRKMVEVRRERYRQQVVDLVRHLSGSARAGLSVSHALSAAAQELGDPIARDLRHVVLSMELGTLPADALEHFKARSTAQEAGLLVNAIVIQQRSGGDLVALLTRLAAGMETFARGRTEAAGIVAGIAAAPWTILGLTLTALFLLNSISDGVLDRLHQWPLLEAAFYAALLMMLSLVPLMRRLTTLEPPT